MGRSPENSGEMTQKLLLKPKEAAAVLSMSERKLWSLKADGTIECIKIGRSVFYSQSYLENWIANQFKTGEGQM